jgi:adenylate cyclase
MTEERFERRLAAILVADVVGYSALIRADEEGTRAAVRQHNTETVEPQIAAHNGRIFKTVGDGLLAEFASVVEAVRCAVEIQSAVKNHNANVVAEKRVEFRIGVNLGDVIAEGDDLHGDGVNVAARLEGLADPQGICISGSAFEQVRDKLEVGFEDLGDQQVKNIGRPVRAYRVLTDSSEAGTLVAAPAKQTTNWKVPALAAALVVIIAAGGLFSWQPWITKVETADPDNLAYPLPEKPSIAVLPFENLSGDTKQDFLSDGITANITTALSRVPDMFVIPRTTTRVYKGKSVTVAQVAEELGVRYVLEGNVQQLGNEVRVTAQLIDTLKGHHIWTESYDREVEDTFVLQDDITLSVLTELEVNLTHGQNAIVRRGNTKSLKAYQLFQRGLLVHRRLTKESNPEARRLFQESVDADPNYANAWTMLGWNSLISADRGWADDPAQARAQALELAHKALAIDPSSGAPYILLATISQQEGRYDEAVAFAEKAVALTPNQASNVANLARALTFAGRPEEALPLIQNVKRYSPITPSILSRWEGVAYHTLGRYEEAIAAFEAAHARNPKGVLPVAFLALTYADAGQLEEARAAAQEVLKLSPGFSTKGFINALLKHKDSTKSERALATLLQLGLPK